MFQNGTILFVKKCSLCGNFLMNCLLSLCLLPLMPLAGLKRQIELVTVSGLNHSILLNPLKHFKYWIMSPLIRLSSRVVSPRCSSFTSQLRFLRQGTSLVALRCKLFNVQTDFVLFIFTKVQSNPFNSNSLGSEEKIRINRCSN